MEKKYEIRIGERDHHDTLSKIYHIWGDFETIHIESNYEDERTYPFVDYQVYNDDKGGFWLTEEIDMLITAYQHQMHVEGQEGNENDE